MKMVLAVGLLLLCACGSGGISKQKKAAEKNTQHVAVPTDSALKGHSDRVNTASTAVEEPQINTAASGQHQAIEEKANRATTVNEEINDNEEEDFMTQTERKFFPKTLSLQTVYHETIRQEKLDGAQYLLPQLPQKSQTIDFYRDGLVAVSYKIMPREVEVELLYEGGATTLNLRRQNGGVIRTITYSAD